MDKFEQKIFEKAIKLLSIRAHAERELAMKLSRVKESTPELVAFAVNECRRLGFLNDNNFSRDYAELLAARGCGFYKIKLNLRNKGLTEENVSAALSAVSAPNDEFERAFTAGSFKLKCLKKDELEIKKREKLYRFLVSRGFRHETIRRVLPLLLNPSECEDA